MLMHSRCDKSSFPIGEFESPCPISLYFLEVGPSRNCVKEANLPLGPTVEGNQPAGRLLGSKELGQSNHVREEMDCQLECEDTLEVDGISNMA